MRLALVNSVPTEVEAMRRVLADAPQHVIAWVARSGDEALYRCRSDTPDLILMDLVMPGMDGVETTRRIMQQTPCAILVVTATVRGRAPKVFDAMGCGALDAVDTPILGTDGGAEGGRRLLAKIAVIERLLGAGRRTAGDGGRQAPMFVMPPLVAIGASTGGPKALANVVSGLPSTFAAGLIVIQHLSAQFTAGLAEWLQSQTSLAVRLAVEDDRVVPGTVLLAATDDHLVMTPNRTLSYTPEPRDCPYRPSVDAFFRSVALHWPARSVAVLLTGMGADGAQGLLTLRRAGWHTIAQDRETSVVYGMPKAAAELGAAVETLPIQNVAPALVKAIACHTKPGARE